MSWIQKAGDSFRTSFEIPWTRYGASSSFLHHLWRTSSNRRRDVQFLQRKYRKRDFRLNFKIMSCKNTVSCLNDRNSRHKDAMLKVRSTKSCLVIHHCFCLWRYSCEYKSSNTFINRHLNLEILTNSLAIFKRDFVMISVSEGWKRPTVAIFSNILVCVIRDFSLLIGLNNSYKNFSFSLKNFNSEFFSHCYFWNDGFFAVFLALVFYLISSLVIDDF